MKFWWGLDFSIWLSAKDHQNYFTKSENLGLLTFSRKKYRALKSLISTFPEMKTRFWAMVFRRWDIRGQCFSLFLGENYLDLRFMVKERVLKTYLESYGVSKTLLSKMCKKNYQKGPIFQNFKWPYLQNRFELDPEIFTGCSDLVTKQNMWKWAKSKKITSSTFWYCLILTENGS